MFFKVLTALLILTVCCAHPLEPQKNLKQAISSQSYVRHDVPLSYKYSAVHIYSTQKPVQSDLKLTRGYHTGVLLPQNIQFSPKPKQVQKLYTTISDPDRYRDINNEYASETAVKKDHLEPNVVNNQALLPQSGFAYIPSHNIELLQSLNRSPDRNAVYRTYPEIFPTKNKPSKVNYPRAFALFKKPENQLQIASQNTNSDAKAYVAASEQKYEQYSNKYNSDGTTEKNEQHSQPHILILNLAHPRNIAHQKFKAPIMIADNSDPSSRTQAFIRKDSSLVEAP